MKKRTKIIIVSVPLLIIIICVIALGTLAPIITGYAAKNLASGIFVSGRSQASLENEDLNFSFIKYNNNTVDFDKKTVESRFLFWKSKAIYIEGFGCILVRDLDEATIRARNYVDVPLPNVNPDTIAWPAGDKLSDTIPKSINLSKLNEVLDEIFADTLPFKGTFGIAVAYKNQLVAERYRDDISPKTRLLSWSMAKSFANTFAGLLVKQGQLDIYAPTELPEWQNDERKTITVNNLLQMNSGLEWNEEYGSNSDVNRMLFKAGDMAAYAINKKVVAKPDSVWYYSSGSTNIVCQIIKNKLDNESDYFAFPRKELFNKIGMRSAVFEPDASGNFIGSSYVYATLRDYVRYGLLYLNNGNWLGNQILPENWTTYTSTPAKGSNKIYGSFFWLNAGGDFPNVPADMYGAHGHDGQYIFIIPSLELVVVRNGFSQKGSFDQRLFLKKIVETIR